MSGGDVCPRMVKLEHAEMLSPANSRIVTAALFMLELSPDHDPRFVVVAVGSVAPMIVTLNGRKEALSTYTSFVEALQRETL